MARASVTLWPTGRSTPSPAPTVSLTWTTSRLPSWNGSAARPTRPSTPSRRSRPTSRRGLGTWTRRSGPRSRAWTAFRCGRSSPVLACPTFGFTWASTTCSTTRCAPERLALEAEAKCVLADRDHVAIGQLLLDHRLPVHQRAVGAAEVADPERAGPDLDPPVVS